MELKFFDKKGDGLSSHCKECRKVYVNNHYSNNKAYYIKKAKTYNKKAFDIYTEYKEKLSCTDCGLSFAGKAYLCDFHHTDKNKERNIGNLKESKRLFEKEVKKCIPLCANCHRTRHNKKQD